MKAPQQNTVQVNAPAPAPAPPQNNAPRSLSYAHDNQSNLPGSPPKMQGAAPKVREAFDKNRDSTIARQKADLNKSEFERRRESPTREQRREAFMIKHDQPKPSLRPGPQLARGPDSSAFNARWENEHRAASKQAVNAKQMRKDSFMKARQEQAQSHTKTRTHNRKGTRS